MARRWKPIETAEKNGKIIRARGRDWGNPSNPWHYVEAVWTENGWRENIEGLPWLPYLSEWDSQTAPR